MWLFKSKQAAISGEFTEKPPKTRFTWNATVNRDPTCTQLTHKVGVWLDGKTYLGDKYVAKHESPEGVAKLIAKTYLAKQNLEPQSGEFYL